MWGGPFRLDGKKLIRWLENLHPTSVAVQPDVGSNDNDNDMLALGISGAKKGLRRLM